MKKLKIVTFILLLVGIVSASGFIGYRYLAQPKGKVIAPTKNNLEKTKNNLEKTKLATIPENYYNISAITFSSSGRRVAYIAKSNGKKLVVVNGQESQDYDDITYGPIFSSDSKYIAYGAKNGRDLWWIVKKVK